MSIVYLSTGTASPGRFSSEAGERLPPGLRILEQNLCNRHLANCSGFRLDLLLRVFSYRRVRYEKETRPRSDAPPLCSNYRSDRKPARSSSEKSFGCSQAAK